MSASTRFNAESRVLALLVEILVDPGGVFRLVGQRGYRIEYCVIPVLLFIAVASLELLVRLSGLEGARVVPVPTLFEADPEGFRAFRYFSGVFQLTLGSTVFFLGTSFVLWSVANVFGNQRVGFRPVLGVLGLSLGIPILGGISTLLLVLATGDSRAAFSLSYLLENDPAHGLVAFLASWIHLFHLWFVYVLGKGLSSLTGLGCHVCIGICLLLWILPKLLVF